MAGLHIKLQFGFFFDSRCCCIFHMSYESVSLTGKRGRIKVKRNVLLNVLLVVWLFVGGAFAADTVPTNIQQPGTQPQEIGNLESPNKCDNCHGGYNTATEPAFNWRGSMMANAGRDPIFWATMAIAEQDFDGSGDLCIRCHSTTGWLGGRSTPTDGSGLAATDSDGRFGIRFLCSLRWNRMPPTKMFNSPCTRYERFALDVSLRRRHKDAHKGFFLRFKINIKDS